MKFMSAIFALSLAPTTLLASQCDFLDSTAFWETANTTEITECLGTTSGAQDNWTLPVQLAASNSADHQVFSALADAGFDPNFPDENGATPLHIAAYSNADAAAIAALLNAGAALNATDVDGQTPLHIVAFRNNPSVVDALISAGANVNAQDNSGRTALHLAAIFTKDIAMVEVLLAANANLAVQDKFGMTPFDYAKINARLQNLNLSDLLNPEAPTATVD